MHRHRPLVAVILLFAFSAPLASAQRTRKPPTLKVVQGKTARTTLSGRALLSLTAVRVTLPDRRRTLQPVKDVSASLGRVSRGRRTLTVTAGPRARLGRSYVLQGLTGRKVTTTIAVQLEVVAPPKPRPDTTTKPPGRTPPPKPDGGKKTTTKRPSTAAVVVFRGRGSALKLERTRYAKITDVRVLQRGRVSRSISARLVKSGDRNHTIQLSAAARAGRTSDLVLQGKIGNRWTTLPVSVTVAERGDRLRDLDAGGTRVHVRSGEWTTLPDGTKVWLGPDQNPPPAGGPMTTAVSSWTPTTSALVGSTLTINGSGLPADAVVKIGDVTLPITSRSAMKLEVRLPDASDDCPPGTLRVLKGDGTLIRSCQTHYFVKGDEAFHHFQPGVTSHRWAHSYLLGLTSLYVYQPDIGAGSWADFKGKYEKKFGDWGFNRFRFVRSQQWGVDTQCAIAANPHLIVVALRGSESHTATKWIKDWASTDFNMTKLAVNQWKNGAWVHRGFYNALNAAYVSIRDHVQALRDNGQTVFVTGHSLGGALATLCGYRLARDGLPVNGVYTYAAPRVGNDKWKEAYGQQGLASRTERWVNKRDFGPRFPGLPSPGWVHVGRCNNIYENHQIHRNDDEIAVVGLVNPAHHDLKDYIGEIHADLSSTLRQQLPPWN